MLVTPQFDECIRPPECFRWGQMGPMLVTPPSLMSAAPYFVFLADLFPKHRETLRITQRRVLSILNQLAKVCALTNNCPRKKLGYDNNQLAKLG